MKKIILSMFISLLAFAGITNQFECGFPLGGNTVSAGGKTFHVITPGDSNDNFSAYNCPEAPNNYQPGDFKEITLVDINFETGEFICSYDKGDGSNPIRIRFTTNDESGHSPCVMALYDTKDYLYENSNEIIEEVMPSLLPNSPSDNPVPYMSNAKNWELLKEVDDYMSKNNFSNVDIVANNNQLIPVDSHTNYKKTVSAVMAGVITLDPDYLGKTASGQTKYINGYGEIELSPSVTNITPNDLTNNSSMLGDLWDKITKGIDYLQSKVFHVRPSTATQSSVISPLDILDTQVLGWYTYFVSNLKNVYYMLIFKLFIAGGVYFTGYVTYKKLMARYGEEPFQFNTISRVSNIALAVLFFSGPFAQDVGSISSANGNSNMIYSSPNSNITLDYYRYSTAAQEMVRYTADYATFFGNYLNDTLLSTYLNFIKFKQGIVSKEEVLGDIKSNYELMQKNTNLLAVEYNFFDKVCKNFFSEYYQQKGTFIAGEKELDNLWMKYSTKDQAKKSLLQQYGLTNINRIDPYLCYKIESTMPTAALAVATAGTNNMNNAAKIVALAEAQTQQTSSAQPNNIIASTIPGLATAKYLMDYIKQIQGTQSLQPTLQNHFIRYYNLVSATNNYIGWLNSVTIPVSYLIFKNSDIFIFANILQSIKEKNGNGNLGSQALLRSKLADKNIKTDMSNYSNTNAIDSLMYTKVEDYDGGLGYNIASTIAGWSSWFMIPIFQNIFTNVKEWLEKTFAPDNDKSVTKKSSIWIVGKVFSLASKVGLGKIVGMIGKVGSVALPLIFVVIAFLVAKMMTEFIISMATMIIASLMLIYKAFIFFLELLIYYVISPFLPIFAFQAGASPKSFLAHYFKNLAVLLITPMIVVFSAYIFIFGYEIVVSIYEGILRFTVLVISLGFDELSATTGGATDNLKTLTKLAMLEGIGDLVKYVLIVFVGYVTIIKLMSWVGEKVGLEGSHFSETSFGELQQRSSKYLNPVT